MKTKITPAERAAWLLLPKSFIYPEPFYHVWIAGGINLDTDQSQCRTKFAAIDKAVRAMKRERAKGNK